jgi:DNA topoisomerase-3
VIVVLAEKPSVARDLAKVLQAHTRRDGYFEGAGYRVTWAIGHLVGLAQPHEINPAWKPWLTANLPMLPSEFPLVVLDDGRKQYSVVERLLRDPTTQSVVAATDAGREGELIFRYIYERARCKKPWQRLWISSLTDAAIRKAFANLEPGARYDGLAAAAKARSRADWLVGMNLSRAYTLSNGALFSVGRVQTPTLAMVVERDRAIRAFVPEHYLEVEANFESAKGKYRGTYYPYPSGGLRDRRGQLQRFKPEQARLPADGVLAKSIAERARQGQARVTAIERQTRRTPPPLLYDLTELQRHANRLYGYTAKQTLDAAQALYERHKVLSYPRTDSRHLSNDIAAHLPEIVRTIAPLYSGLAADGCGERALGKRFVDDAKVGDHHALIPTANTARLPAGSAEARLYDLVCRRLLMAWHTDLVEAVSTLVSELQPRDASQPMDLYVTRGTSLEAPGWTLLEQRSKPKTGLASAPSIPAGLIQGDPQTVTSASILAKQTEPPKHFNEASLLTAMESAGKSLDDKQLIEALRDAGLGTPATRAAILETLIARGYLARDSKNLLCTPAGEALIDAVHPQVKSAAMTGSWELRLRRMERGEEPFDAFMHGIEDYVRSVVQVVAGAAHAASSGAALRAPLRAPSGAAPVTRSGSAQRTASRAPSDRTPAALSGSARKMPTRVPVEAKLAPAAFSGSARHTPPRTPTDSRVALQSTTSTPATDSGRTPGLPTLLRERFGFAAFRPHQETICQALTAGRDALVVMPTGAGKSLCYQLPGIARGGTTLVVSPLIALIEDQSAKLAELGLCSERIHSGRDRQTSREVCQRYLRGELDFLFIAPERLRVPGFVELLAKRTPALIAIDEAHCISAWGHDFRPDYRMLHERLKPLRAAPIIALTATATPTVQRDILEQLGMPTAAAFILGFRRVNLAIEVVACPARSRGSTVRAILSQPGTLPAIVYAPTRKATEQITRALRANMRVAAYHAGLSSTARTSAQRKFLDGKLDCVVATIAFGMGIDKADVRSVIHSALPSSLEGYYQEIGRAGRDGQPSRAIMLHDPSDRRTHEFFLERDYPPEREFERLQALLSPTPTPRPALAARLRKAPAFVDNLLEKLWVHGGVVLDEATVARTPGDWRPSYARQRQHRIDQLERVAAYVATSQCRMGALVHHFGDRADAGTPCGLCDVCAPSGAVTALVRSAKPDAPTAREPRARKRRARRGPAKFRRRKS